MNIRASRLNPAFFILALLAFCFGSGCKESPTDQQDSNGGGPVTPPGTPTVKIISPAPSAILHESVPVEVEVQGIASVKSVQLFFDGKTDPSMILVSRPYRYTRSLPYGADSVAWEIKAVAVSGDNKTYASDSIGVRVFKVAAPTDLRVKYVFDGPLLLRAELTWTSRSLHADFAIERSIDGQAYQTVRTVGPSVTGLVIDGPFEVGIHRFRIAAVTTGGQLTAYCTSWDTLDTRPAMDILQTLMNGDSIAWDFHGGTWSYGASTAYYRGPKTWKLAGTRIEGGERITVVNETFYGYRYKIDPIPRDTVWLGAVSTELTFRETADGLMRFGSGNSGSWGSWSALGFPRYWRGIGETTNVSYPDGYDGYGPRLNLTIHPENGLTYLESRSSGSGTSYVCVLVRR